jgi:uncharacterized membrane protein
MWFVRAPLLLTAVAVGATIARVASLWPALPPVMASHFGANGQPDAWTSRAAFFGLFCGTMGLTLLALLTAPLWLRWMPVRLVNMPNREHWLAPERKAHTLRRLGGWMNWMSFLTAALALVVLELTLQANIHRRALANGPFLFAVAIYVLGTVALVVGIYRSFRLPKSTGH